MASAPPLYPLVFAPVFQERVWGGRALARFYPGALPPGRIGESWVLSDHPAGRTRVARGPLEGATLADLRAAYGPQFLGTAGLCPRTGRFSLLIKLLDAQDDLSVQVHPADEDPILPPGEAGKTEMWLVLHAEPGARIVHGLRPGTTPDAFAAALARGAVEECLHTVPVQAGDVVFIPAGTVHALGRGLVVAEVQQSSDVVYRVYDYGRLGLDGKPRPLHVQEALAVTRYAPPPPVAHPPRPAPGSWQELVCCPYFVVERGTGAGHWPQAAGPESFHALLVLAGEGAIAWDGGQEPLAPGAAVLVPAGCAYALEGDLDVLRARVPGPGEAAPAGPAV